MSRVYVDAGDVVTVVGKSTEAGLTMHFSGRRLVVEIRERNGELYPAIRRKYGAPPRDDLSMAAVAFYPDGQGRWFYVDNGDADSKPEWEG